MANILQFNPASYFLFFLVFLRISGLFVTAPVLGSESVPRSLRVYLVIICSLILFNIVPPLNISLNSLNTADYFLLATKELMIGLLLGVIPRVMFAAINFAGTIIGFMMGLSIANVIDPQSDLQVSIIASFEGMLATVMFIVMDGHHIFFEAMAISFQKIPVGGFIFSSSKIDILLRIMGDLIIIGAKLGAPLIVALLLANVIMGFMGRSMPQMNIFIVGFPFTIGLGLIMLILGMPHLVQAMAKLFNASGRQIAELLEIMAR